MKLEEYRNKLIHRNRICGLYFLLMLLPHVFFKMTGSDPFNGFVLGALAGLELILVFITARQMAAVSDDKKLKELYIHEHDERRTAICHKTSSVGVPIILGALMLAMMVAGYFSKTVFFTLMGVALFMSAVLLGLRLWYGRTM